ncbi:MAG TPA: DUF4019 domain-containing protein [Rhizomicrobium sp.]|nr:DUF4019 domain-containing protein [Rhizomicrobium sp.]
MKRFGPVAFVVLATFDIAIATSSGVLAQPSATPDAAAKLWLFNVDGGDYAKGWDRAGDPFKAQMTAPVLQSKIAPVREPLGAIMQRKLFNVIFSNTAPGLPEGKYAIVQFSSRFANNAITGETVWLDMENDRWAVIGYFITSGVPRIAGPPATGLDRSQAGAIAASAPGAMNCTHAELVQARIARMNGYTGGPKCNPPQ